jgi:hypothetical protein
MMKLLAPPLGTSGLESWGEMSRLIEEGKVPAGLTADAAWPAVL